MRTPDIGPCDQASSGRFCWLDLAASDAAGAEAFYRAMFGWKSRDEPMHGGSFTRFSQSGADLGSLYQLSRAQRERGVPSHWTPYVRVDGVDDALLRAASLGGEVIVRPLLMPGLARIALVLDPVGALIGLWEPVGASSKENSHAQAR